MKDQMYIIYYLRGLYDADWLDGKRVISDDYNIGYMDCVEDLLDMFDEDFKRPQPVNEKDTEENEDTEENIYVRN